MGTRTYFSIVGLAREMGVDVSYVYKLVKRHRIRTILGVLEGESRLHKAISVKDVIRLKKLELSLVVGVFDGKKYITLDDIAEDMGKDKSGLHKKIRAGGLKFTYLRVFTERTRSIKRKGKNVEEETVVCSGRAKPCLTRAQYIKFKEKHFKAR